MKKTIMLGMLSAFFFLATGFKTMPNEINTASLYVVEDNGAATYFIGDSRLYMMRLSTGGQAVNWLAECGSGYAVLVNQVAPLMDQENLFGKTILIEYGINDIIMNGGASAPIAQYAYFYNTKAQEWAAKGARVKVLLVMPSCNAELNSEIYRFNAAMMTQLPKNIQVVNVNGTVPFGYVDNVHFNDATSTALYYQLLK